MKPLLDGEKEAWKIRGTEGQSEHLPDANFDRKSGSQSLSDGSEQIGIHRNDCPPGQATEPIVIRERIIGGILSHLIGEYRSQMDAKKQEIDDLESKVRELELFRQELGQLPQ